MSHPKSNGQEPSMWEEEGVGRRGQPIRILRTDRTAGGKLTCDRLTDAQVSFWCHVFTDPRHGHFDMLVRKLLVAECERRGLSPDSDDLVGQLTIPFGEESP